MNDLYLALTVVSGASAGAFALGHSLARSVDARAAGARAVLACAFIVCFALSLRDRLFLTRMLPSSAVVIYGNALPPAVALLAGQAWRRIPGRAWRRASLVTPLALLCLCQSYGFLLAAPPPLDHRWKDGVCRQTSPGSCSAAAAATLLRTCGIKTTESEMADLCLTRPAGTSMLGLYRGLKLKTAGTGWSVQAFRGDVASLRTEAGAVILSVRLEAGADVDPRYEQAWGWTPGVAHTVVFYGFRSDGKADIGDPAAGREQWRVRDLKVLWHGDGIRLVRG
jgi:hypothetical protein